MTLKMFQVDAFTESPFHGNPAGVCVLEHPMADGLMQSIAAEMNLSETAFLIKEGSAYRLRWFTPRVEVDLCGHATLASAHILWERGFLNQDSMAVFQTRSGKLTAVKHQNWIVMDFPALSPIEYDVPEALSDIMKSDIIYFGKSNFDWIVEVADEDFVKRLQPDFSQIQRLPARGLIITSRSRQYDFISRFFAPAVGVNEDPVTGSAHSVLTPYWAEKLGKTEMSAYQASERGGLLRLSHHGTRVGIGGQAVTMMEINFIGEGE